MSSTQPPHHHHHHHHHHPQHSQHPLPQHQPTLGASHNLQTYGGVSSASSNTHSSKTTLAGPIGQLQLFADERKEAIALPKIEADALSINSSHPSSPYSSPQLAPRARLGAIGPMEEVTLPPIQAAVPMRRGAVSGASSGPSLPFPPIRLSYEEEDVPSRGPSPTLGKRSSFSMGHSNHVPPGPDVQLPTPVLSGSGERRGGVAVPSYVTGQSLYHGDGPSSDIPRSGGLRLPEESHGHYQSNSLRPVLPWTQNKSSMVHREESVDTSAQPPPFHPYHPSSPMASSSIPISRSGHFNDEQQQQQRHYSHVRLPHQSHHQLPYSTQPRSASGGYRYDYHREGSAMSPSSSHSMLPGDASLSPRTGQSHIMHDDPQGHETDSILNGKRPRSAPRVMSSQPRIFACTQCPARFARNHDLKRHQRGHLSVRPYPCNWCGKSFSRKDALKRHILVKGCGKNGKGGGGSDRKGDSKGKRSGGDDDDDKGMHREGSSGDQDDDQYGEDDDQDEGASEDHPDGRGDHAQRYKHETQWQSREGAAFTTLPPEDKRALTYFSVKDEYRAKFKDTLIQVDAASYDQPNPLAAHRRASAFVA